MSDYLKQIYLKGSCHVNYPYLILKHHTIHMSHDAKLIRTGFRFIIKL